MQKFKRLALKLKQLNTEKEKEIEGLKLKLEESTQAEATPPQQAAEINQVCIEGDRQGRESVCVCMCVCVCVGVCVWVGGWMSMLSTGSLWPWYRWGDRIDKADRG